jgi:hypothetical protein
VGQFFVRDPATDEIWPVDPNEYLKSRQTQKMLGQPDMILQFAHILADNFRARGVAHPEVRARVLVSLNGRRPQLIVDPQVDLAKEQRNLWPAKWIVPLNVPFADRSTAGQPEPDVE